MFTKAEIQKIGILGCPGQFRWVATYYGFPNTFGLANTPEGALVELVKIYRDRPWEFSPEEFIYAGENEWFYLQQWPEALKGHAIERLVNTPELREAIAQMSQAQISACVQTAMRMMGVGIMPPS